MYIKLGTINLHYYQDTSDWIILGEILDSGMSYEKPILVRTTEELDIWFGKDFKDYSYMQELINMGVALYLYKPISNQTSGNDSYIDLDKYTENNNIWLRDVETGWVGRVVESPEQYKFRYNNGIEIKEVGLKKNSSGSLSITEDVDGRTLCTEETAREELLTPINQISKIYESPIKFHVFNSEDFWIYKDGEIIDTELLPQNINLTSISGNNRDTLVVSKPEDTINYTYLDYNEESGEFGIFHDKTLIDSLESLDPRYIVEIDTEKVATGYQTLMFQIEGEQLEDGDYFVIPNANHGTDQSQWKLLYTNLEKVPIAITLMFGDRMRIKVNNFNDLLSKLTNDLGYARVDNNKFYSRSIIPVTNFYRSGNIKLIPETKITEAILSKYMTPGMEFASKTIGRSSEFEDDLIKVVIEKPGDNYRVTIFRYSYSETFEGLLKNTLGEQRLDNLISEQSKLIRCNFYGEELRTGTYFLRGATSEETSPEMYKYSLKRMLSTEYTVPVYPDYFLIPDKYKYTSDIINDSPFQMFLDYSTEVGSQFLIENESVDELFNIVKVDVLPTNRKEGTYYKVGDIYYDWQGNIVTDPFFINVVSNGGDFIYNLTTDKENKLIYFFKSMTYKYAERPGYYAYLRGVLLNEFSISVKDILYENPTTDAFLVDDIENVLKRYKSNYLVCDNQTYFYKDYQDGDNYITTGWTRFIAGKVFRELQKNSGDILGQQLLGVIRSKIIELISSISNGFSIVRDIGITEFEPTDNGQSLKVSLATVMNDQVKSDVNLDITVNYNNNIYGTIS
jgi:hypothetical protein